MYRGEIITCTEEHPFYIREKVSTWNNNLSPGYYFADFFYRIDNQPNLDGEDFANLGSCAVCSIYFVDSHAASGNRQFFSMTPGGVMTSMKRLIEIKNIFDNQRLEKRCD